MTSLTRHIYKVTEYGLLLQNSLLDIKRGDKFIMFNPRYFTGSSVPICIALSDGYTDVTGEDAVLLSTTLDRKMYLLT